MTIHIKFVHDEIKPHICSNCATSFQSKYKLTRHIESVHEGKKLHKCDVCEKRYSDKYDLTRHIKAVHEGKEGKTKECPFCHAYFQPKYLKKHISTVMGNIKKQ